MICPRKRESDFEDVKDSFPGAKIPLPANTSDEEVDEIIKWIRNSLRKWLGEMGVKIDKDEGLPQ